MTIRIDGALKPSGQHGWRWFIKGIYGRGIYGTLCTKFDEPGLYIHHTDQIPDAFELIDRNFNLSREASTFEAIQSLETALCEIGWGPVMEDNEIDT